MNFTEPIAIGGRVAPGRLLFGPHETNLGRGRAIADRHVAYYLRRARGGASLIVTEEASVHESDWPYERAPLASECGTGWEMVADAVHGAETGTLVLAGLGHAGSQGSSAYSQQPMFAPSHVPDVVSREVPKSMEATDIDEVVLGFGDAAAQAVRAGMDGVEVNAGQFSLVRQFLSGLTNMRGDQWGQDRLLFARAVLESVREGLVRGGRGGPAAVLGLRLSCDELAPWAGLTPESAQEVAIALAPLVDYLVVVRGSIFTASATRPDMHTPPMFNRDLCLQMRQGLRAAEVAVPVVLQGSVVDAGDAQQALADGVCDLVEMTRAQIADPALGAKVRAGVAETVRPCTRCNQMCQVRDARNPIVSCIVEPSSGHELDDPSPLPDDTDAISTRSSAQAPRTEVLVVGGGPAGMEAARVAATLGHDVTLVEASASLGGNLAIATTAQGRDGFGAVLRWWESELARLGVTVVTGELVTAERVQAARDEAVNVIITVGSRRAEPEYDLDPHVTSSVVDAPTFLADTQRALAGVTTVVLDPIGGPIGVSVAETAVARGATVVFVTQDHIAGNELARSGDLAPANARLQQAGVDIVRRVVVRNVRAADAAETLPIEVVTRERFSGNDRIIPADLVIDAGFRLPDQGLRDELVRAGLSEEALDACIAGDAVAPRTVHEAVLEARRVTAATLQNQAHR